MHFARGLATVMLLAIGCSRSPRTLEVSGDLSDMLARYLTGLAERQWQAREQAIAAIQTPAQVAERQARIRPRILAALGDFPETKTPLRPKVTGTLVREGYRIEKVIFESLPEFYVTANVYVPAQGHGPYPAVLITAGHGWGGKALSSSQQVGASFARRGIIGLAYDPVGQGERLEYFDDEMGRSLAGRGPTFEHMMADWQCRLTGGGYAGYEIWDGVRAVDYLIGRGDVDPARIGVTGNSGGGTQAAYLAAVEPRLAVAHSVCYMTNWRTLWSGPGPQDAEQSPTGFLSEGLDFGDLILAYAPRPFQMTAGKGDYFPIEGARATAAEARRLYGILGEADAFDFLESDGPHGYLQSRREATYRLMQQRLNQRHDDNGAEGDVPVEPDQDLHCTATGQLATSLRGKTVHLLNREIAERRYASRKLASSPQSAGQVIAARLAINVNAREPAPAASSRGELRRLRHRIEKIAFESEPGITIPALVLVPDRGPARKPAILYLNPAGKAAGINSGDGRDAWHRWDPEVLADAGYVVMAPDLRGWGESVPRTPTNPGASGYSADYQTAARALLLGKPLAGMQVTDLLRSFDYLTSRPDVEPGRVAVFGKSDGGVIALYAAALEPRIEKVVAEGALYSYLAVAQRKFHDKVERILVPGVLADFDLPDVCAAIAPRPVWIVSPVTPTQMPAALEDVIEAYAPAQAAFVRAGHPERFRILRRLQGVPFEKHYTSWMKETKE